MCGASLPPMLSSHPLDLPWTCGTCRSRSRSISGRLFCHHCLPSSPAIGSATRRRKRRRNPPTLAFAAESKQPTKFVLPQCSANQDMDLRFTKQIGYSNRRGVLASISGITLAFLGTTTDAGQTFGSEKPKSNYNITGTSPWFIGSLVFGYLFWQKHQERVRSDTDLQNIHTKIKHAEAELCCKTNTAIRLKKEKEHALWESCKDQKENEALLYQIICNKSKENELQQQLDAEIEKLHYLTDQASNLSIAYDESKKHGILLSESYNKEVERRAMLENELLAVVSQIKVEEDNVLCHRLRLDGRKNVHQGSVLYDADDFVYLSEIEKLEKEKLSMSRSLEEKDSTLQNLTLDLVVVKSKNKAFDQELTEIQDRLTSQGHIFRKEMAVLKGTSDSKDIEVEELASELDEEHKKLEGSLREVNNLVEERNYLVEALNEKQNLVKQLKSQMDSVSQMLINFDQETVSLNKELVDLRKHKEDLEKMCEELEVEGALELGALSKVLDEEKEMTISLQEDLHEAKEDFEILKIESDHLRQKMNSQSTCYEELKKKISSTHESQQVASHSCRREKKMFSTAKKRLDSSKLALEEQEDIVRGLKENLLDTTNLSQESRDQLLCLSRHIEDLNAQAFLLESEISSLQNQVMEEGIRRKDLKDLNKEGNQERRTRKRRTRIESKKVKELIDAEEDIHAAVENTLNSEAN